MPPYINKLLQTFFVEILLTRKCDPLAVNNNSPGKLHPIYTFGCFILKQYCFTLPWQKSKLGVTLWQAVAVSHCILNCICSVWMIYSWVLTNQAPALSVKVQEPEWCVWAPPPPPASWTREVSLLFCVTFWVICLLNHRKATLSSTSIPQVSARKKKKKTVCSFKHNSHVHVMFWYFPHCLACQGKASIVYSPITNSMWQRIFRHSGQICKISGNEFQPAQRHSDLQV